MVRSGKAGFRGWWVCLALCLCFCSSIYEKLCEFKSGGVAILGFYGREGVSVML